MGNNNRSAVSKIRSLHGFTLVELIVVITILVILGTIGFVNMSGFSSSARDGDRVSTLKGIDSGLALYQIKTGSYPMPEASSSQAVLTGSIGGTTYTYLGFIADANARIIKMSKTPVDPLSKTQYIYAVSKDQKYYQTATTLENTVSSIDSSFLPVAYAAISYQARVHGNYLGYFKYSSGSETWITNAPSLIWNNTGSTDLLSTGTYFVVNKQVNLPYSLDANTPIQSKNGAQMIQLITGNVTATLTGVNITSITTGSGVSGVFTGVLLASFGGNVANIQSVVLGQTTAQSSSSQTSTLCSPGSYSATGNTPCTITSAGFYVSNTGATTQLQCSTGYYCASGSTTATQTTCPANSWCAIGSASPTACVGGTSPAGSTNIGQCVPYMWVFSNDFGNTYVGGSNTWSMTNYGTCGTCSAGNVGSYCSMSWNLYPPTDGDCPNMYCGQRHRCQ